MDPESTLCPCRLARWRDLPTVRRLHRACFPHPYSIWRLAGFLASGQSWVWLAERHGAAIGYVILSASSYPQPSRLVGEIISLGVLPAGRRAGVGRQLLQTALAQTEHDGLGEVYLQVAVDNQAAQALYTAAGFGRLRTLRAYYVDGQDAWLMRRPPAPPEPETPPFSPPWPDSSRTRPPA
jgi:ribosomal-protein-alanine N-acetyltransferase